MIQHHSNASHRPMKLRRCFNVKCPSAFNIKVVSEKKKKKQKKSKFDARGKLLMRCSTFYIRLISVHNSSGVKMCPSASVRKCAQLGECLYKSIDFYTNREGCDQTARMRRLIRAITVRMS